MTKFEFILAQFKKTHNKIYENYVITKLYNLLNDNTIKFITQQYIKRPNGYALVDLYFPQFDLYVEIDESHHKDNVTLDQLRYRDIVDATNFSEKRIIVYDKTQEEIDIQIYDISNYIKKLKNEQLVNNLFIEWNIDMEMNPDYYINLGYIDFKDNVSFNTQNDVFKCFGKNYKTTYWRCAIKHPNEKNTSVWCPKFFEHKDWYNEVSEDYSIIKTKSKKGDINFIESCKKTNENPFTYVFGHIISPLGNKSYKFLGLYKFNYDKSIEEGIKIYERIGTKVETIKSNK